MQTMSQWGFFPTTTSDVVSDDSICSSKWFSVSSCPIKICHHDRPNEFQCHPNFPLIAFSIEMLIIKEMIKNDRDERKVKKRNLIICKPTKHAIIFDQLEKRRRLLVTEASHNHSDFGRHTYIWNHSDKECAPLACLHKIFKNTWKYYESFKCVLFAKPFL